MSANRGESQAGGSVDGVVDPAAVVDVRDNPSANRYEAWVDERLAGFAEYRPMTGRLVFVHTWVDAAFAGRGIGRRLAAGALADVRARGLRVTPVCRFIAAYVRAHPEHGDLVVGIRGTTPATGSP
jgi:hypothetical protein